jgi:hypothetical protein
MKNLLLLIFIITSCTQNPLKRQTASSSHEQRLANLITQMSVDVDQHIPSYEYCHTKINNYYSEFYQLDAKTSGLYKMSEAEINSLIELSFQTRLKIRERLMSLDRSNEFFGPCLSAIRSIVRVLRYAEDYMIEHVAKTQVKNADTLVTLEGEGSYFLKNPKFNFSSHRDLQSGDVIISRGNAYTSAAISRIGVDEAQFSHASFVYQDPEGKTYTTEAHIEIGSVVEPFQVHLDQQNARTVVYRYKDSVHAHAASVAIMERVKKNQAKKKNVPYDFAMKYLEPEDLFCSEVIYAGFQMTAVPLDVPIYKSTFSKGLIPFLNRMGIEVNESNIETFETFAPGDLEFDPRFELVAEWRHPHKVRNSLIKDAILSSMFDWMEKGNYRFKPGTGISSQSYMAWLLRRTPFIKKQLQNKFPLNMKPTQLQLFITLEKVAEQIENELQQEIKQEVVSYKEIMQKIEKIRVKDLELYKQKKKKSFHKYFRPIR